MLSRFKNTLRSIGASPAPYAWFDAAERGDIARMKVIMADTRFDIDGKNEKGQTALLLATTHSQIAAIDFLLNLGADIQAKDNNDNNALSLSAMNGHTSIVNLLLAHGANINAKNRLGDTPVMIARNQRHELLAKYLDDVAAGRIKRPSPADLNPVLTQTSIKANSSPNAITIMRSVKARPFGRDKPSLASTTELPTASKSKSSLASLLHIAALQGDTKIVRHLLDRGADIHAKGHGNATALHLAVIGFDKKTLTNEDTSFSIIQPRQYISGGNVETICLLLERGANVNANADNNMTPLHIATLHGNIEAITLLLDRGANIYARGVDDASVLHMAAVSFDNNVLFYGDKTETIRLLLIRGADANARDDTHTTALHTAALHCNIEAIRLLHSNGADIHAVDDNGSTVLHALANFKGVSKRSERQRRLAAELLLAYGIDISAVNCNGHTAAMVAQIVPGSHHLAVYLNDVIAGKIARPTLADLNLPLLPVSVTNSSAPKNTNATIPCSSSSSPPFGTSSSTSSAPVKLPSTLATQLPISSKNNLRSLSLAEPPPEWFEAAAQGNLLQLKNLIEALQFDINTKDKKGLTALHLAAKNGHLGAIKFLLTLNADIHVKDDDGNTLLHLAAQEGHTSIINFVLSQGVTLFIKNYHGNTALHMASGSNQFEKIVDLVERDRNINAINYYGITVFDTVMVDGKIKTVKYLLKRGANIHISQNKSGWTPLHLAAGYKTQRWSPRHIAKLIYLLISYGADIRAIDDEGRTIIHLLEERLCKYGDQLYCSNRISGLIQDLRDMTSGKKPKPMLEDISKIGISSSPKVEENSSPAFSNAPSQWFKAAKHGNVKQMQRLLNKNIFDINATERERWTALHFAIKHGRLEAIRFLLSRGADIYKNRYSYDALCTAIAEDQVGALRLLIEHDANVLIKSYRTTLHLAAEHNSIACLWFLVELGIDVEATDITGISALHLAAKGGHLEAIRFLLDHKADINAEDNNGMSALLLAIEKGHKEAVICLLEYKANIPIQALHIAAAGGHIDIVRLLLDNQADVHAKSESDGTTALHWAFREGHGDIIGCLLEHGADPHAKDNRGITPLHWIAACSEPAILDNGVEQGIVDIHIKTYDGYTMLHMATVIDNRAMIQCLVNHSVDANATTIHDLSALHLAAASGNIDVIDLLLTAGANIQHEANIMLTTNFLYRLNHHRPYYLLNELLSRPTADLYISCNHQTALCWAARGNQPKAITRLLEQGINIHTRDNSGPSALHWAAKGGYLEVTEILLERGADINVTDEYGATPLHWAVEGGHSEAIRLLLRHGADIHAKDNKGCTPLHKFEQHHNLELIQLLISANANIHVCDNHKRGVLHRAAKKGHVGAIRLLLSLGSNIDAKDENGNTPLHKAARNEQLNALGFLLDSGADIHAKDNDGSAALHKAAEKSHSGALYLLLDYGADIYTVNAAGQTAIDLIKAQTDYSNKRKLQNLVQSLENIALGKKANSPVSSLNPSSSSHDDLSQSSNSLPQVTKLPHQKPEPMAFEQANSNDWDNFTGGSINDTDLSEIPVNPTSVAEPSSSTSNPSISSSQAGPSSSSSPITIPTSSSSSAPEVLNSFTPTEVSHIRKTIASGGLASQSELDQVRDTLSYTKGLAPDEMTRIREALTSGGLASQSDLTRMYKQLETYHSKRHHWYESLQGDENAALRSFSVRFEQALGQIMAACFLISSGYIKLGKETTQQKVAHLIKLGLESLGFIGMLAKAGEATISAFELIHELIPFASFINNVVSSSAVERLPEYAVLPQGLKTGLSKVTRAFTGDGLNRAERVGNLASLYDIEAMVFRITQLVTTMHGAQIRSLSAVNAIPRFADITVSVIVYAIKEGAEGKGIITNLHADEQILLALAMGGRAGDTKLALTHTNPVSGKAITVTSRELLQHSGIEIEATSQLLPGETAQPGGEKWRRANVTMTDAKRTLLGYRSMSLAHATYIREQTTLRGGQTWGAELTVQPQPVPTATTRLSLPNIPSFFATTPKPEPLAPTSAAELGKMARRTEKLRQQQAIQQELAELRQREAERARREHEQAERDARQQQAFEQRLREQQALEQQLSKLTERNVSLQQDLSALQQKQDEIIRKIAPPDSSPVMVSGSSDAQLYAQAAQSSPRPTMSSQVTHHLLSQIPEHQERMEITAHELVKTKEDIAQLQRQIRLLQRQGAENLAESSVTPLPTKSRSQLGPHAQASRSSNHTSASSPSIFKASQPKPDPKQTTPKLKPNDGKRRKNLSNPDYPKPSASGHGLR
jgi:ankyrin repeat protein